MSGNLCSEESSARVTVLVVPSERVILTVLGRLLWANASIESVLPETMRISWILVSPWRPSLTQGCSPCRPRADAGDPSSSGQFKSKLSVVGTGGLEVVTDVTTAPMMAGTGAEPSE